MSKIIFLFCAVVFALWWYHFDADAYHVAQQSKQMQPVELVQSSQKSVAPTLSATNNELLFPLKDKDLSDVISGYGDKRSSGKRQHEGIDIPADRGTPLYAVATGTITKVTDKGNGGKQVWLRTTDGKYTFFYAHLDSWTVGEGQLINQGDQVGTVGNTGNAKHTLPHLHFGVYVGRRKTIDPSGLFERS